jgi:AcrR family transcriptional regulator
VVKETAERDRYHHGDLRAALLAAAETELSEKGVEGFTLRGCAKRAGVSHAAPAHHFGDADGLLTALAAEGFQRFTWAMRTRQAMAPKGGWTPLEAAGLGYLDFSAANPAMFRLMFSSARPRFDDPSLSPAAEEAFGVLVEAVTDARGANPWADAQGPADVAAAWALAHGMADLLMSGRLKFLNVEAGPQRDKVLAGVLARLLLEAPSAS